MGRSYLVADDRKLAGRQPPSFAAVRAGSRPRGRDSGSTWETRAEDAENEAATGVEQAGHVGEGVTQMAWAAKPEVAGHRIEDPSLEHARNSRTSLDIGDAEAS
jgi:hypothetical protein